MSELQFRTGYVCGQGANEGNTKQGSHDHIGEQREQLHEQESSERAEDDPTDIQAGQNRESCSSQGGMIPGSLPKV